MSQLNRLRQKQRISYYEPEEPSLDEYVYCEECMDFVFEYCSVHGALLVIPDDKVPAKPKYPSFVPRAALTIPRIFLHLAPSIIPGAGIGVFCTLTLPRGVRFGPYRGVRSNQVDSSYCWQIYDRNNKPSHVVDAADGNRSNWMRYVNCARHWREQNLVAYQYQGQLYYRTIKIIPRFTELMVFYGSEFAHRLGVDLRFYNAPPGYAAKYGVPVTKKPKLDLQQQKLQITSFNIGKNTVKVDKSNPTSKTVTKSTAVTVSKELTNSEVQKKQILKTTSNHDINTTEPAPVSKESIKYVENCNSQKSVVIEKVCENVSTKRLICDICNYSYNNKNSLLAHIRSHSVQNPYNCNVCHTSFNCSSHLKRHAYTHSGDKPYKCKVCQKSFNQSINLKKHTLVHTGEKPYQCEVCQKSFNDSGNLKRHTLVHHTGDKPYQCSVCQKSFNQSGHWKAHTLVHTGVKPYQCEVCQKSFNYSGTLKKHTLIHTGEKPYQCSVCQKSFNDSSTLKKHSLIHTGEKPYQCEVCQKSFNQSGSLKKHTIIHTGEKPYHCQVCQKSFNRSSSLKIHIVIHTGEKPYKCQVCHKSFNHSGTLKKHTLLHTGEKPYQCEVCQKSFNRTDTLQAHILIHTGEKLYKCQVCQKSFNNSGTLKKHKLIHTSESPYECEICESRFTCRSSLTKHIRVHM